MARFDGLRRFVRIDRSRGAVDRAVDEELQFHFDMTTRDLMANGMSPDDARRETERRFGDVRRTREGLAAIDRSREDSERRAEWWTAFTQDLRYALRGMRLKPGFAIAIILTLGLGIGANATMFGIVDRLLFRPPSFLVAPDRAGKIYFARMTRDKEDKYSYFSYRRYLDIRESTTSFDAMTPFYMNTMAIGSGDATKEMLVGIGDADLWRMFAVKPVIGRFFTAAEAAPPDGADVIVLSYAFWQTQFGGRRDILGTTIDMGPGKYTIIGVAPDGFRGFATSPVVAFMPIAAASKYYGNPKNPWYSQYGMNWFEVFARRKPGVTPKAADADLTLAQQRSYRAELEKSPDNTSFAIAKPRSFLGPVLRDRGPNAGNDAKVATWLGGVAGMVLLIACANVANLLLARALRRRREIAVRIALGVSRVRLAAQLLTESMLLAIAGGALGIMIAQWGGAVVRKALLGDKVEVNAFADQRLLLFSSALVVVIGLLTGLAPVFQARRADVSASLKAGAREGTVHRSRLRAGLLIGQAALSVILLVGAGLFVRSLQNVRNIRLGYDSDRLLWVDFTFRNTTLDSLGEIALRQKVLAAAKALPEVENAARANAVPFWQTWQASLYIDGIDSVDKLGQFTLQAATSEFFATVGTRILRGRGISTEDRADAPHVMVVGESMAKRLWPAVDPIGKCVKVDKPTSPCYAVVGIAEDVRRGNLTKPDLHYYLSIDQFYPRGGGLFVRTHASDAAQVAEQVRRGLQQVMPGSSYITVTAMTTILGGETKSWRLGATMFAVFGALALILAAIGLYSVIAYNVAQRTHEMGVRVALGAQVRDVVALIVGEGLRVVVPGVALGAIIALLSGRWIAPLLFQVSPKDPPVISSVIVVLIVVAIAAAWVPALRASRVDPNQALRAD